MKTNFLSIFILLIIACNPKTTEPLKESDIDTVEFEDPENDLLNTEVMVDTLNEGVNTEESDDEEVVVIMQFKKTACFGKCPVFSVELLSDGRIFYNGKANVEKIGMYESNVNDSFVYTVYQEADKIKFYSLKDKYPVEGDEIPDLPKTITFLKNGKKEHQVTNAYSSPLTLQQFETYLWDKIESLYWTKIGPQD